MKNLRRFFLSTVVATCFATSLQAADLYVSPTGTSAGPGTLSQPYNLATALSGKVGKAGDTFWLRAGTYQLGYIETGIQGAPGYPITFRQMPGELARVNGSITFYGGSGHVILRDFELFSSDTKRVSTTSGTMTPTDLNLKSGLFVFTPNMSFINLVIHDHVRHGIYASSEAPNLTLYGCLIYNNGWSSVDNADGHNVYMHNTTGTKVMQDNITFNGTANNFQIYTDGSSASLVNITMDGNVAFNGGAINKNTRRFRDFLVGVDSPAVRADNVTFDNNMGYYIPGSKTLPQVQIGREGINGTLRMRNNYLPQGVLMNNWKVATVTGNLFAPVTTDYMVNLQQNLTGLTATWNNNVYQRQVAGTDFRYNASSQTLAGWRSATGYDANSTYASGRIPGTDVFVRPNKYEAGRANIVVYNWDGLAYIDVDVSSAIASGTQFEVRNAQDYFAAPVLTGTYNGQSLRLPMTGLTVAKPSATLGVAPSTGPTFNVFILKPVSGGTVTPPPTTTTNTPPTISSVAAQTIAVNTSTAVLPFSVNDAQTAAANLTVTASSSNTTLVPNASIVLGGSGTNRTVKVTPAANQTGTATITLRVSDGTLTASRTFTVTVSGTTTTPTNTAPTISSIPNQTVVRGRSTGPLPFTIGDVETPAANLTVTGRSSNTTLIPNSHFIFGGSGANRTVNVWPRKNRRGQATITITVSDGTKTASTSYVVTVQ
jgi:hypothetical protein